jgi:hypothetical protein
MRKKKTSFCKLMTMMMLPLLTASTVVSCAASLDMSDERIASPGPEWGVVMGSVLVRPERSAPKSAATDDRFAAYEFEVVQIQPGDPNGERAYADRYELEAVAGQERHFLSRLRPGQYLIKNFHRSGVTGTGGDLNLLFESRPGEVRYVGRVLVELPQRLSSGNEYRFAVEDGREGTLERFSKHGDLTNQAVTVPMSIRRDGTR